MFDCKNEFTWKKKKIVPSYVSFPPHLNLPLRLPQTEDKCMKPYISRSYSNKGARNSISIPKELIPNQKNTVMVSVAQSNTTNH